MAVYAAFGTEDIRVMDIREYKEWNGDTGRFNFLVGRNNARARSRSQWFEWSSLEPSERQILFCLAQEAGLTKDIRAYNSKRSSHAVELKTRHINKYEPLARRMYNRKPKYAKSIGKTGVSRPVDHPKFGENAVIGEYLYAEHKGSFWKAKVANICTSKQRMFVHYDGWNRRHDEWIDIGSHRLASFENITLPAAPTAPVLVQPRVHTALFELNSDDEEEEVEVDDADDVEDDVESDSDEDVYVYQLAKRSV